MTEWRTIPSYPLYEASSDGDIRRIGKPAPLTRCHDKKRAKPYPLVSLSIEGKRINGPVHILVCMTFHGPKPSRSHHAAHEDGNPENNHKDNISWKTPAENEADKIRHGTVATGSRNAKARFSEAQVGEIRKRYSNLPRIGKKVKHGARAALAAEYNVNSTYLWHLINLNWKHV